MPQITQIRKLSIWIFFVPLLAINFCLFISQNPGFLENTFFKVDMIGRSGFSIPYLDGSLSISRASRTFPQYLIFKPAMIVTAITLYYYWLNNNKLINKYNFTNINYRFIPSPHIVLESTDVKLKDNSVKISTIKNCFNRIFKI